MGKPVSEATRKRISESVKLATIEGRRKKAEKNVGLPGERYGRVVVMREAAPYISPLGDFKSRMVEVRCDCGDTYVCQLSTLRWKQRSADAMCRRCAHVQRRKPVPLRFGDLIVLKETTVYPTGRGRRRTFECRCKCGSVREYEIQRLNHITQCPQCSRAIGHARLRPWESRYNVLVSTSIERNKTVEFSYEEYVQHFVNHPCHYCGAQLNWDAFKKNATGSNLDRKDNAVGYRVTNCVACCVDCNYIKGSRLTYCEMLEVGKLLLKLRSEGNAYNSC